MGGGSKKIRRGFKLSQSQAAPTQEEGEGGLHAAATAGSASTTTHVNGLLGVQSALQQNIARPDHDYSADDAADNDGSATQALEELLQYPP
jgi:hypothetical protein